MQHNAAHWTATGTVAIWPVRFVKALLSQHDLMVEMNDDAGLHMRARPPVAGLQHAAQRHKIGGPILPAQQACRTRARSARRQPSSTSSVTRSDRAASRGDLAALRSNTATAHHHAAQRPSISAV